MHSCPGLKEYIQVIKKKKRGREWADRHRKQKQRRRHKWCTTPLYWLLLSMNVHWGLRTTHSSWWQGLYSLGMEHRSHLLPVGMNILPFYPETVSLKSWLPGQETPPRHQRADKHQHLREGTHLPGSTSYPPVLLSVLTCKPSTCCVLNRILQTGHIWYPSATLCSDHALVKDVFSS